MKNLQVTRNCLQCGKERSVKQSVLRKGHGRFCSVPCGLEFNWNQPEHKTKMVLAHKGKMPQNIELLVSLSRSTERRHKQSEWCKTIAGWNKGVRTKEPQNRKSDAFYSNWRKNVYKRDSFKCRISNIDCAGRIEAHHILPWRDYKELRYDVNNGITLCHFHHPLKWEDEKRLAGQFTNLVKNYG